MKRIIHANTTGNRPRIEMRAGYHEFNIYIDGVYVFTADSGCTEDWYEYKNDTTQYGELFVDGMLEVLEEDAIDTDDWEKYDLVKKNRNAVIKVVAEFVYDWIRG